jgi:hypothetical protein
MRFKGILVIVLFAWLCIPATQSNAETFSVVNTIDMYSLVKDTGSIELDVVGNELYVANCGSKTNIFALTLSPLP